jgi:Spy/CpxP family protein refolding chaperone
MNRRMTFLSAFAAVLMMSMVAYGQRQGGPGGGRGMGSGMLLRQEIVQKELNITADQLAKLKDVLEARPGGGGQQNPRDMTDEERQKMREEMGKRMAEQEKKIADVLDDKQEARLKQLRLQVGGAMAIMSEDVSKELKITEEQTGKMRAAMQEMRDARQGGGGGPEGFAEMREKMNAKVMEILTDAQKAQYKEMLGPAFDISKLRMGGPGGGRRGGN